MASQNVLVVKHHGYKETLGGDIMKMAFKYFMDNPPRVERLFFFFFLLHLAACSLSSPARD